jgi:hypothetical protein
MAHPLTVDYAATSRNRSASIVLLSCSSWFSTIQTIKFVCIDDMDTLPVRGEKLIVRLFELFEIRYIDFHLMEKQELHFRLENIPHRVVIKLLQKWILFELLKYEPTVPEPSQLRRKGGLLNSDAALYCDMPVLGPYHHPPALATPGQKKTANWTSRQDRGPACRTDRSKHGSDESGTGHGRARN